MSIFVSIGSVGRPVFVGVKTDKVFHPGCDGLRIHQTSGHTYTDTSAIDVVGSGCLPIHTAKQYVLPPFQNVLPFSLPMTS